MLRLADEFACRLIDLTGELWDTCGCVEYGDYWRSDGYSSYVWLERRKWFKPSGETTRPDNVTLSAVCGQRFKVNCSLGDYCAFFAYSATDMLCYRYVSLLSEDPVSELATFVKEFYAEKDSLTERALSGGSTFRRQR